MIFLIYQILFKITLACDNVCEGICLTNVDNQIQTFNVTGSNGYRFGFWSKYLSMSSTYNTNLALFDNNQQGYTVFRQIDPATSQTLFILYQNWRYQDDSEYKYLKFGTFTNNELKVLEGPQYDASTYEGLWVYYSVAYVAAGEIQFNIYTDTSFYQQLFSINYEINSQIQLNLGGRFSFDYQGNPFVLADFSGQLSEVNFQQSSQILLTKKDFLIYLSNFDMPIMNCQLQVFETTRIEGLQYETGSIFLESWIKLDVYAQLNVTVNVFGIEFPISFGEQTTYQKLLDIHYFIWQAVETPFSATYLKVFKKLTSDYIQSLDQWMGQDESNNHILTTGHVKEWHFVQVYYGQEYQRLKMWFSDGTSDEVLKNYKLFRFEDRKLIVRSGDLFDISQPGVTVNTGSSKIYLCKSEIIFQKICHHSCLDCDGFEYSNCLTCTQDRYLDNRQCKCNLGSLENSNGICDIFANVFPTSEFSFERASFSFYQFGSFPITYEGNTFFFPCPKYYYKSVIIYCVECLSSPETFSETPICASDYVLNEYEQYELQIRQTKDIELYIIDYVLKQFRVCSGCQTTSKNQVDDTYFFSDEVQLYIKCLDGFYQDNQMCLACSSDCLICKNSQICTLCDGIKVLNQQGQCLSCLDNCEQCALNSSNSVVCLQCAEKYSLYQGICMACGKYCKTCQYSLDTYTNTYYNRCLVCLDSSQYYLKLSAIDCGVNTIENCINVIEMHHNSDVQQLDNTMWHMYNKRDYQSSDILTYCAWCGPGFRSYILGSCIPLDLDNSKDEYGNTCGLEFDYITPGSINTGCGAYLIENQNPDHYMFSLINGCYGLIPNCYSCFISLCVECFPGYYTDIYSGDCHPCPTLCYRCMQQSKIHKNGWKKHLRFSYGFFKKDQYYKTVFGDEKSDKLEVVCQECSTGYELYQEQCIPVCPVNCKTCKKVNMQNYCVECHSYDGKLLSLYEGTCIECPRYCSLCYPKSSVLITSANPYFKENEKYLSATHTCLLLQVGLDQNEYIYNIGLKQFLKYNSQLIDPNKLEIQFNVYCDSTKFDEDMYNEVNQEEFLSKNVRIDEILSQNATQTNFDRFENDQLFQYFGTQQIQLIEYYFLLQQDCTINQISYLSTSITKNVYAINQAQVILDGNNNSFILQQSLEIIGFEYIELKNINFEMLNNHISFQSLKSLDVIMMNVNVTSQTNFFPFQLTRIHSLTIQQMKIMDSDFSEINGIFKLIDQQDDLTLNFTNLQIMGSSFLDSNLISNNENLKVTIVKNNLTVSDCIFKNSSLITTKYSYYLTLTGVRIQGTTFTDCSKVFMTDLSYNFTLYDSVINRTELTNSVLFYLNSLSQIDVFTLLNIVLQKSTILTSDFSSYIDLKLQNFIINNITLNEESSFLYASSTVGQIELDHWNLRSVQLSSDSLINSGTVSYLMYLQATTITLNYITLSRQSGMTEFYLGKATNILISNLNIKNGNPIQSLIANSQCTPNFVYSRYITVLHIEESQFIKFDQVTILDLVVFDVPIIQINSIGSQFVKRSESITISNFVISNCVIQKSLTQNQISIFQIISEQKISINFENGQFNYNLYHSQDAESETNSALAMYLSTGNGNLTVDNCIFQGNYISQSKNSLMVIFAIKIEVINSNFTQNNYFTKQFIKHVNWGFKINEIPINLLANYFPMQSLSGNGKLQANNVTIQSVNINGGTGVQGGCFYVALNNDGVLTSVYSNFSNISVQTRGGCFYIVDKASSITINLQNTIFNTIFSVSEGGVIFFTPLSQTIKITLTSLTIVDVFSLQGAFLRINFFNSIAQELQVSDCKIVSTQEGMVKFIKELGTINDIKKTQLIQSTAFFVVQQGVLTFQNVYANLYIIALLEVAFQSKVSLTSMIIHDSFFSLKPVIAVSCTQEDTCKVFLNKLEVQNYNIYDQSSTFKINVTRDYQSVLSSDCGNTLVVTDTEFEEKIINMSEFGNGIPQLILISGIKANDQISQKACTFSSNTCSSCENGLIQLSFNEEIQNSANFQLKKIQVFDNDCGTNGCLNIKLNSQISSRLLAQEEFQITITQLVCSNNRAVNGACIYSQGVGLLISESIISINNATNYGGGVYYSGDVKNLLLYNNLISNNVAGSGGALYVEGSSSPQLNKTNNFISSSIQSIQSSPTSLSVTLNNYQNLFYNYHTETNLGFLTANQKDEIILILPSGQQLNTYQYFNTTAQEYKLMDITFRVVPLNDYFERQKNLTSTSCQIKSGYMHNQSFIMTNNYTNINTTVFNEESQDYNFDDLIIYYGANNVKGNLILLFYCNSVKIPVYESVFPYQIINYITNYTLQVTIKTLDCQLGEYKSEQDDSCHLCDITKKQYSVKYGAQSCNFMDEDTTSEITPAQLKLKTVILNLYQRVIGDQNLEMKQQKNVRIKWGIVQGAGNKETKLVLLDNWVHVVNPVIHIIQGDLDSIVKNNYILVDYVRIQGNKFSIFLLHLYGIMFSYYRTIISINLTAKGIENMIIEIQKNRVGKIQLIINANKQTGPYIKMFTNYLQNIAIILNFNVDIPNGLKLYFNILGNPQQQLLISTDCLIVSQIDGNIMYIKIIQTLINPIVYGLIYLFIYFILVKLDKVVYNKIVITTSILYLFFYFQPQTMQLLISSLSYQTIAGIEWVQANLAYQFYTEEHQKWLPYFIVLIVLFGFLFPAMLLISLIRQRKEIYANQLRKNWGYLILEYRPTAYFWEFARILTRELIIIAITFYQDNITLKCVLVFFIIIIYQQGTTGIQPFKTAALNQLDIRSSQVCLITILAILSLTQSMKQYSLVLVLFLIPNTLLFVAFLAQLFLSYLQEYEALLDKVRDFLRGKLSTERSVFLSSLVQNRQERRKIVMERFKLIKKYLYSKTRKSLTQQTYKFITEIDTGKEKPYDTLFTKSDSKTGSKAIFLFKN